MILALLIVGCMNVDFLCFSEARSARPAIRCLPC